MSSCLFLFFLSTSFLAALPEQGSNSNWRITKQLGSLHLLKPGLHVFPVVCCWWSVQMHQFADWSQEDVGTEERIYSFVFSCSQFMPQRYVGRGITRHFSWGSVCFISVHTNDYSTTQNREELGKEAAFHSLPLWGRWEIPNYGQCPKLVRLTGTHLTFCLSVVRCQIQVTWVSVLSTKTLRFS